MVAFRGVVRGGGVSCGKGGEGVGRTGGVEWGQAQEPASQCARVCQNYPLGNYHLVSPRKKPPNIDT